MSRAIKKKKKKVLRQGKIEARAHEEDEGGNSRKIKEENCDQLSFLGF